MIEWITQDLLATIIDWILIIIFHLIQILLYPINLIIGNALPNLVGAMTGVGVLFSTIGNSIGWAVSLTGLSSATLSLIVAYFVFKLTVPAIFWFLKLALAWWNKLKT